MGGLLSALNAGKTGLFTNQKGIEVTGNNITNVNTEGYSRQRIITSPLPTLDLNGFFVGHGVAVTAITREHDAFLERQLQDKNASLGEETGKANPLVELEGIFNIGEQNLGTEIDKFFDSWQELAANPGGSIEREAVIQRGIILSNTFQSTAKNLDTINNNVITGIIAKVGQINQKLAEVADLNQQISGIEATGLTANSLRDRRDVLLQDLAYSLGTKNYEDNSSMVTVQLPGGLSLVQSSQPMTLQADNASGVLTLKLIDGTSTLNLSTNNLGGELKGMYQVSNQTIGTLRDNLDKLAFTLSNEVNTQHNLGVGLDGNTYDFFTPLAVQANASRNISVNITNSNHVAAGTTSAPGDNRNAQAITALGDASLINGNDTFVGFYGRITAALGLEVNQNRLTLKGTEDTLNQLKNLREGKVGVSLEEEMINLIQYQRGFEASAKILSTIDEMMVSVLQIKR